MNTRNAVVSPLPSSVLDCLRRSKALIFKREHWTQRAIARDANDDHVEARSPGACKWCMLGAVMSVIPHHAADNSKFHSKMRNDALSTLAIAIEMHGDKSMTLTRFNDHHEHKDVLAVFDIAIQLAGGGPR